MPPPVFCGKGPTAGHTGPAPTHPMMDFRRAACSHAAAKDGQCRPPYGWIWGRCNRADVGIGPYEGVMYHRGSRRPQGSPLRSAARRSVKRGVGDAAPHDILSVKGA